MTGVFATGWPETPPDEARLAAGALKAALGFLPNLAAAMSASPSAFEGYVQGLGLLGRGTGLTPVEVQLAMIAASVANRAPYGVALHSTLAGKVGADEKAIEAARDGTPADGRETALLGLARAMVLERGGPSEAELDAFHDAGFGRAALVELAWAVAMKHFANTVAHVSAPVLDPPLEDRAWTVSAAGARR